MKLDRMRGAAAVTFLAVCAFGCAAPSMPAAEPLASASQEDAARALAGLLADSDEAFLVRNPIVAIYRGDYRFLAQHGDYLSDAYVAAERAAARLDLQRLAAIDRSRLGAVDRIARDTFEWQRSLDLRQYQPEMVALWLPLKLNHLDGWHMFFPDLSSGEGAAPYKTVADYDAGLARIDGFVAYLDAAVARAREGAARGVVQPRLVVKRMVAQFDHFATQPLEASPYYGPIRRLPADMPAAERERLTRAYAGAIGTRLVPAFARTRDALSNEVLPKAGTSIGLSQLPGGAAYYRLLVETNTTTRMTPEEIHRLGLAEVARIATALQAIKTRVGYPGTLAQFQEFLRSDARFRPASAGALGDGYRDIGRRVEAAMPRLFSSAPKTPLEIRPMPAYQEKTDAGARYMDGSLAAGRPGIFFFNTWDLRSRSTFTMETLYLHEAVPGHHYQSSLAQENEALPKLLRFGGNTAYLEGWALYAESLGPELGMEIDPYQRVGGYDYEMWRALRLVVDTGIHAMGWSREQAIDYMLANSANGRTDTVAEVERYIANPGQALAYKVGELSIRRLRGRAEAALGARFDVREFHRQVLDTGALPMSVLEAKIDAWIEARRATP
jgi:uncharacterized protein (DUF885 family)